jgi:uncharacterized protein (DUF2141 family)
VAQKIKKYHYILFVLLASCAQMFPPSGGEKDVTPPQILEEKTTPKNRTVNFNSKTIVLVFDEYVKLNNPGEQIIISPAMEEKPDYVLKGKKLFIALNSELKPNTTYTINFGNCISDITENNPAAGMTYVFSTGAFIDSLSLNGTVTNAFTNAPEKNVWVLLHKNLSDTSFQKNFPDYLAKTDANGNYSLQNLSAGEYKIYALKDGNSDYKYSQPSEEIAFHNETIVVAEKNEAVNLRLFNELSEKQYLKSSKFIWPGRLQMVMNRPYTEWNATVLPYDTIAKANMHSIYKNTIGDTIDIWLRKPATENGSEINVVLSMGENQAKDTITFRVTGVKEKIPPMNLKTNAHTNFSLYDKLKLKYDRPTMLWKKEKMHLFKNDSVKVPIETGVLGYGISLINKWENKTSYNLILEDSAFADVFYKQYSKADTISFSTVRKDFYGSILAQISVADTNYVVEILGASDKAIYQGKIISDKKLIIEHLKPGTYKMKIYYDSNRNGKWDTGNLIEKKQPEKIYYYNEPIVIRSNWDFELTWKIEN